MIGTGALEWFLELEIGASVCLTSSLHSLLGRRYHGLHGVYEYEQNQI